MNTNDNVPAACHNESGEWKSLLDLRLEAEHHGRQYSLGDRREDHEARLVECEHARAATKEHLMQGKLPLALANDPEDPWCANFVSWVTDLLNDPDPDPKDEFALVCELRDMGHLRAGSRRRPKPGRLKITLRRGEFFYGHCQW